MIWNGAKQQTKKWKLGKRKMFSVFVTALLKYTLLLSCWRNTELLLIELKVFTCIVDGMCPQQMGYVVSPGLSVFPVARLQGDAVSGPWGLSDPHLELHSLLADALSQAHLIRLHGEVLKSHTNSMTGSLLLTQSHCWKCFMWFRWGERQDTWLGIHQRFACSIFTRAHLDVTLPLCKEYEW